MFGYVDEIGMFKSKQFITMPLIEFKISELAVDNTSVVVGIGPAVSAAMLAGSNISLPTVPVPNV